MASSEESLRNLELECHYLSQALEKLRRNSPEWNFLHQKLEAAEEELDAMRQDEEMRSPTPGRRKSLQSTSPYRDAGNDDEEEHDHRSGSGNSVWNDDESENNYHHHSDNYYDEHFGGGASEGGNDSDRNDRNPIFDATSYEPVYPGGSVERPSVRQPYRGNPIEPYRDDPSSTSSTNDIDPMSMTADTAISTKNEGWTKPRRKILAVSVLTVTLLIVCILLFTVGKGDENTNAANQGNENVNTSNGSSDRIAGPCASFSLHLIPDQFGNETSWEVIRYKDEGKANDVRGAHDTAVLSGGPYSYKKGFNSEKPGSSGHYEMVHATTCLSEGSYAFILYDARGDGMCCSYGRGEYGVNLSKGKVIRPLSEGKFVGTQEITRFQVGAADIDVLPPPPDITTTNSNAVSDDSDPTQHIIGTHSPTLPCASFSMHLIPDQFGNETSWKIRRHDGLGDKGKAASELTQADLAGGIPIMVGGPYKYRKDFDHDAIGSHYEMVHATTCLPVGTYTFTLYDAKKDGICCDYGRGEYGINLSKGKVIRPLSSGNFAGAGQVTPFQVTTEDIDVIPKVSSSSTADTVSVPKSPSDDVSLPSSSSSMMEDTSADEASNEDEACASFYMHLVPDQWGNETLWEVLQYDGEESVEEDECQALGAADEDADDDDDDDGSYSPTSSPVEERGRRFLRDIVVGPSSRKVQQSPKKNWISVLQGGPYSYQKDFDSESGGSHYNAIIAEDCLPIACYKMIIYDEGDDGICCDYGRGEYGINLSKGRVIRPLSKGEFGASQVTSFQVTDKDLDVFPESSSSSTDTATNNDASDVSSPSVIDINPEDPSETSVPGSNTPLSSSSSSIADTSSLKDEIESVVASLPTTAITTQSTLTSLVTVPDNDMTHRGKSYGILFDVEATSSLSSITISHMDLFLDTTSPIHYEIWTKEGSWQDVKGTNAGYFTGFRQVSHGSITGSGPSEFTTITPGDFQNVEVKGGQRQAFWVTSRDNSLIYKSYEAAGVGRHEMTGGGNIIQVSSEEKNFNVFYGTAVREYPLELADPETDFWYNAGFLGRLWYKETDINASFQEPP